MIFVQSLPSQPSPNCCSTPLMGEYTKAATDTTNCETNTKKNPQTPSGETNREAQWKRLFTFRFHLRQRTALVLLHLPCASARLPRQPFALQVDCPEVQNYWGSCLDLLHAAQIVKIYPFVLCIFQEPKRLGLLVFSIFLHMTAVCSSL